MSDSDIKQLLSVMATTQQDMHELKYEFIRIIVNDNTKIAQQLQDIQVRLMLLEAILKKHFNSDFNDDCNIPESSDSM